MSAISRRLTSVSKLSLLAGMATALILPTMAQAQVIDEIITTAQRTEQNLQDVPIAVTVLTTEQLEMNQVQDVLDLQSYIPNINIATNTGTANAARIFLRGVGEDESRGAVDQAVGIYVDGVYIGRSVGSLLDVVDLAQIEVLRGPQGTLYGRNTIGGAIKLDSVKPQFENSGDVRVTLGNNNRYDLRGTANLSMGDRSALRLTGLLRERDGFHDVIPNGFQANERRDNVGGLHVASLRGSFYHEFENNWNVLLSVDNTVDRSDPIPDSIAPGLDADNDIFTIEPAPTTMCPATGGFIGFSLGCFTSYDARVQTGGVSAKVTGEYGDIDVTSITAYRTMEDNLTTRIGFPYSQETDQDQISQELTFASSFGDSFDWLAGMYYWKENLLLQSTFVFPFSVDVETRSFAVFGQGTYSVSEQLDLTGGVRITQEKKDLDAARIGSTFARQESQDFDNVSFTVGADYRVNPDTLVYGKFSTGFKSGGWSPDAFGPAAVFLPVEEETLDSLEGGLKADFMDSRVRLNSAVFFNKYEDLQIAATVPGLGFTRFNVNEAEIKGLELEGVFQVTDNFQINGNIGILDAEYTDLTADQARGLNGNNQFNVCGAGGAATIATDASAIACSLGLNLKNAPEYKFTIGAQYDADMANGKLMVSGNISQEDESWSLVANSPGHALVESLTLANARIKYADENGWSVALWGKNITNEEYYRATSATANTTYASEPLTYGVDLGYTF